MANPSDSKERVAVVAVHGVGKHDPGASAQAMADLLLGLNSFTDAENGSPYTEFVASQIEVPLPGPELFAETSRHALKAKKTAQPKPVLERMLAVADERRGFFQEQYEVSTWREEREQNEKRTQKKAPTTAQKPDVSDEFMATQLDEYEGDQLNGKYESCRLKGTRSDAGAGAAEVHIYEMYWADLAKRDNSLLRFFMSLYQLLIHLSSLGRTAVDHIALEHPGSLPWFLLQRSYNYATRVLTLGIFNLLVLLPVVAFAPITYKTPHAWIRPIATAMVALVAAAIAGFVVRTVRPVFGRLHWLYFSTFAAAIVGGATGAGWAAESLFASHRHGAPGVLDVAWWVVAYAIVYFFIFKNYDEVRAGARESGLVAMVAVVAGFIASLLWVVYRQPDQAHQMYQAASFVMIQYVFLALRMCWIALLALAVFAYLMELVCVRRTKDRNARGRARAALRTGRFALALPTVLLLLITTLFWNGAFYFIQEKLQVYPGHRLTAKHPELPQAPLWSFLDPLVIRADEVSCLIDAGCPKPASQTNDSQSATSNLTSATSGADASRANAEQATPYSDEDPEQSPNNQFLRGLLIQGTPIELPLVLLSLGAGFLLLILLAAPSAVQELTHPRSANNEQSRKLGEWLSGGFSSFRFAIMFFWLAAFGIPALYMVAATISYLSAHGDFSYMLYVYSWHGKWLAIGLLSGTGAILGSAAVMVTTIGKTVLKSAGAILDTVLDVDNYLRTSPAKETPRARIVERYVGLLRFLHVYRDAQGRGYDRIVIVAHSLGSLISADLLRFLKHGRIAPLTEYAYAGRGPGSIPIRFFTMGSPLRQLLNRFFPNLYEYMRLVPDDAGEAPDPAVPVPGIIPENALPQTEDLGLEKWVNTYRSGDYIGRPVWLDGWLERTKEGDHDGAFPYPVEASYFTDAGEHRVEACIGLGAHTHYWDRSAPDVGLRLDRLIVAKAAKAVKAKAAPSSGQ